MTLKQLSLGIGITMFAAVTAVGVFAAGQNTSGDPRPGKFGGPGGRGGPGGPGGLGRMAMPGPGGLDLPLGRLNLTDAQKDQVMAIMESHREEMKALADRAVAAHDALEAAVTADTLDDATIRARSNDVAGVDADMAVERAHVRAEVLQILTDAQRSELKALPQRAGRAGGPGRADR